MNKEGKRRYNKRCTYLSLANAMEERRVTERTDKEAECMYRKERNDKTDEIGGRCRSERKAAAAVLFYIYIRRSTTREEEKISRIKIKSTYRVILSPYLLELLTRREPSNSVDSPNSLFYNKAVDRNRTGVSEQLDTYLPVTCLFVDGNSCCSVRERLLLVLSSESCHYPTNMMRLI